MAAEPLLPAGAEAYLEAIYVLQIEKGEVQAARVAEYLGVSAVSVSRALGRLERQGEIGRRTPRVELSPIGWEHARAVVRRHRLAERWLADRLHLSLVEAHREAEKLEHALSGRVEEALFEELGRPRTCPHGNPIPGWGTEERPARDALALSSAPPGAYVVDRIFEQLEGLEDRLDWVERHGLLPGRHFGVDGDGSVRIEGVAGRVTVPPSVGSRLLVRPVSQ